MTTDFHTAPRRAVRLTVVIDADTRDDLASHLIHMANQVSRGELERGVTGGPSAGSIFELLEDPTQTHDGYFAQVRAYLAALEAESIQAEAANNEGES